MERHSTVFLNTKALTIKLPNGRDLDEAQALLMSVKAASQPIPALLGFTSYFGYFRSMETDQREKEEPSTSSPAWDVAANYVQNCTGCFAITVLPKQSNCLPSISPKTSKKLFSIINCSFHRTTCKWFLIFLQQQLKDFYFWCYKDSNSIYKVAVTSSYLSGQLQKFSPSFMVNAVPRKTVQVLWG